MSSSAVKRQATYQDLLALPDNVVGEILNGELHTQPRPSAPHALAISRMGIELGGPFDIGRGGPGGWWILDEPELHLGNDILVPDLAGWHKERLPRIPQTAAIELAPDWVCEVRSPATARKDRMIKLPLYGQHGVAWCWMVDPDAQTIEVYNFAAGRWVLQGVHGENSKARLEPFDAVELDLSLFWTT